jgi:hypothetical protein
MQVLGSEFSVLASSEDFTAEIASSKNGSQ